ncbi:Phage repressor protein C, contains Cro/C1-type HTH and peptisase s24 domains [Marinobacter sp. es.048]|uniref:XRE family transcriptional regulator n=1 Tax=Marinobacter sp. es.048 TaxID=1761795 RepID=UPI000B587319|nr:helix-turn-helix transcriptional regulator [Marinobacter sp. es.048]SNC76960.1 Phage repressor protein C, contains Cro/C1-type HTH and peptisase s24 domains [Marinobacter sp. es.048]
MTDFNELETTHAERSGDVSSRIKTLMGNLSESAFAQKCKIPLSTMRKYLSGSTPGLDKAAQIAEATGVPLEWLAAGKQPTKSDSQFEEEFALIPGYNVQVAAGHGAIAGDEAPTRELAFRRKWLRFRGFHEQDLVLVFAKGDSMEPTISDNETVMVDTSERKLRDGHIYVIRNGDHLLVKRIQTLWNDGVQLLSDNKEYPPQEISTNDLQSLEVIGKVVWVGKDL